MTTIHLMLLVNRIICLTFYRLFELFKWLFIENEMRIELSSDLLTSIDQKLDNEFVHRRYFGEFHYVNIFSICFILGTEISI